MNGDAKEKTNIEFSIVISGFKETSKDTLTACLDLLPGETGETEIFFVDNTTDSRHRQMVVDIGHSRSGTRARVHYIPVPVPGKAAAQNAALSRCCGQFVLCLDDDVLPCRDLLREYEKAFTSYPCAAVQGRVELFFEGVVKPPLWLDSRLRLDLAEMDFGKVIHPFEMGLTGANMAFRREVFRKYGFFDERFGPGRTGTLEDQEFSERIQSAGEIQLFWPEAAVQHRIPASRLKAKSFALIHYDVGYSDYLLSRHLVKGGFLKFGIYTIRQMGRHFGRLIFALIRGQKADAVFAYAEIFKCLGYYRQYSISRNDLPPKAGPE